MGSGCVIFLEAPSPGPIHSGQAMQRTPLKFLGCAQLSLSFLSISLLGPETIECLPCCHSSHHPTPYATTRSLPLASHLQMQAVEVGIGMGIQPFGVMWNFRIPDTPTKGVEASSPVCPSPHNPDLTSTCLCQGLPYTAPVVSTPYSSQLAGLGLC